MKKYAFVFCLTVLGLSKTYGQQADSMQRIKMKYYQTHLATDDVTTQKITDLIDSYKVKIKQILKAKGLTVKQKSDKVEKLIADQKNSLAALLSPQQIQIMAPVFEVEKRDTVTPQGKNN